MLVISTGGLAPLFADVTKVIKHLAPDVTMRGLAEIYHRNRPSASGRGGGKTAARLPRKDKRK
jgi:hypothetical protein